MLNGSTTFMLSTNKGKFFFLFKKVNLEQKRSDGGAAGGQEVNTFKNLPQKGF